MKHFKNYTDNSLSGAFTESGFAAGHFGGDGLPPFYA